MSFGRKKFDPVQRNTEHKIATKVEVHAESSAEVNNASTTDEILVTAASDNNNQKIDNTEDANNDSLGQAFKAVEKPINRLADSVVRSEHYANIRQVVFATIDVVSALEQTREQVRQEVDLIIAETVRTDNLPITLSEQRQMAQEILHDMFGVGPIEPLLADHKFR